MLFLQFFVLLVHLLIAPAQLLIALLQTGHLVNLSSHSFLHRVLHKNFKAACM